MTTTTLDIQRRLLLLGYAPGPADGLRGRLTIGAIRSFQASHSLVVDGIAGPLTVAALNRAGGLSPASPPLSEDDIAPPWVENIRPYLGLQERRDGKKLRDYLDSDGSTVGDPALIPWCGDLVQTALALTLPDEPLPGNPFYALNWAEWGVTVPAGMVPAGAIGTKRRYDSRGKVVGGHVFIVVGHDETHLFALGGNQNNSICIVLIRKSDLNGTLRYPRTYPRPTHGLPLSTLAAAIDATEA